MMVFAPVAKAQISYPPINAGTTVPGTCNPALGPGELNLFWNTASYSLYYCSAVNTWTVIGSTPGSGITTLNTLTADPQTFTTGTTGTDFGISSVTATHTFNLPVASGTNTGKLSSTNWSTFNNKAATGTCTNQAVTGISSSAVTCTTITSAYTSGTFAPTAHNVLSASHGDSTTASPTRGDLIVAIGVAPKWERYAKGTQYQVLTGGANEPAWSALALDQTTATSGILGSAKGGTGNGWAKFSGPTTAEKTFTLPDASATIEVQANKDAASGYAGLTAGTKLAAAQGQEVWAAADLSDLAGLFGTVAGTKAVTTALAGDPTTDNCVKWIAGGKLGDAGAACGSGGGSHNVLSATHSDSTASAAVRGGAIFAIGATPKWEQVAHSSTTGGYWKWNGTDVVASTGAASGTGTPTACTNQFVSGFTLAADGAPTSTCTTLTAASAQLANQGTTTTLLHGNASGNPSWAGVSLTGDATANQGTTTTVLHGNASGQPTFAAVTSADTTGTFAPTAHNVLSASHGDSTTASATRGDIIVAIGVSPKWEKYAKGTQYQSLTGGANEPTWSAIALDQSTATSGILGSVKGGTGNGWTKFTGPTTTEKSFALPDASATILTTNAVVTVAQGGTGAAPGADDQVLVSDSTSAGTWRSIPNCNTGNSLSYTASTNLFSCEADDVGAGGGGYDAVSGDTGTASKTASEGLKFVGTASQIATVAADATPDTVTFSFPAQLDFSGKEIMGGAAPFKFEGATDNNIYWKLSIADPTIGDKTTTVPNFDTTLPQPGTCTNQVYTALNATTGAFTCNTITSAFTSGTFAATAHDLLSTGHGDTLAGSVVLGDMLYGNATPKWAGLAGNITSTKKWLTQTGTGAISAAPTWGDVKLDDLSAPSGNTAFTMAAKQLKFTWTTPSVADGAFELEATGAFTGDLMHIHQHTGNPGATDLVHLEAVDVDVVPLAITSANTYGITSNKPINVSVATGTAPFVVASTTEVANLTAAKATAATNTAITDDTTTAATMYPTWVTTASGNQEQKVSSTKLTFDPSTGTLSAPAFTTAGANIVFEALKTYSNPAAAKYGVVSTIRAAETSAPNANVLIGGQFTAQITGTNTQNWTETTFGQTGVLGQFALDATATGTVSRAQGLLSTANISAATLTNFYGLRVQEATGAGTLTNEYGVYIEPLTKGTTLNYSIYTAGTTEARFGGAVNAISGFQVNGAAANGACLVGNGTNFVSNSCSAGGGTTVTVNGVALAESTGDFDDADPAAPANGVNVKWQINATPSPDSVSAYLDTTAVGTTTFGAGSDFTWSFNDAGASSPTLAFASGAIALTAQGTNKSITLTPSGSGDILPGTTGFDLGSATLPVADFFLSGTSGTPGTNNFKVTGASTSGTRIFTLPDANSNPVQPLTCTSTDKVSAISALGVLTCTADSGGAAYWEGLTNSANTATSYVSNNTAETFTIDFQAAFTTGCQFCVKSSVGTPSGGTLMSVTTHDADVTPFTVTGSAGTSVSISPSAGDMTLTATATNGGLKFIPNGTGDFTFGVGQAFTETFDAGATDPVIDYSSGNIKYSGATTYTYEGGATDPVWTPGNSIMNLSTGTLQQGGVLVGLTNAIGTTGTAPNWATATLNIPLATTTTVTAGLISKSEFDTFNAKAQTGSPTACTNQFVTDLDLTSSGAPTITCTTATLASAQFANQGTTTTVLHGAAAGNPSFGAIVGGDMTAGTVGTTQLATANKTFVKSFTILSPTTGDTNLVQMYFPQAITITRVACSVAAATSVTIQLDERTEALPNTAGTDVMSGTLACDVDSQTTTSFANATIATRVPLNVQITATSGTPGAVRGHIEYTID